MITVDSYTMESIRELMRKTLLSSVSDVISEAVNTYWLIYHAAPSGSVIRVATLNGVRVVTVTHEAEQLQAGGG